VKVCTGCKELKPCPDFFKNKASKDGRRSLCKKCCYIRYGESSRVKARQWGRDNPEKNRKRAREWEKADPKRQAAGFERIRIWKKNHPERFATVDRSHCRARHARKLQAMPKWANMFFITEAYELARLRTKLTGIQWHVDHIVPLRSKKVCGLHVENNLRVIPGIINSSKANRYWPDMAA